MRILLVVAGAVAALFGAPALAQQRDGPEARLTALRALDARVATIGHRLAVASRDLCADQAWLPGIVIHDLAQYGGADRAAAARLFGLGDGPAVLALAEGGPAARAGLRADDRLVALDGVRLAAFAPGPDPSFAGVERSLEAIDIAFADGAADLAILRGEQAMTISVAADRGCATRFQMIPSRRLNARADGRYVQLTSGIVSYVLDENELAAVAAHEFAHNILQHRRRLDAQQVQRGFFGNFGRNARLIRETEIEADRLSLYLVDRAGYDIDAAGRFWRRFGPRGLILFEAPTHPHWRSRVAALAAEAQRIREARAAGRPAIAPAPAGPGSS